MRKAILFDFDGTIADTIPAIAEGLNLTMQKYGYPTHTNDAVRTFINNGPRLLVTRAMPEHERNDAQISAVLSDYDQFYQTVALHTKEAYPGMRELIAKLHGKGYRIGVLSNKQDTILPAIVAQVLERESYDAVQGMLPDHPTKPDPYLSNKIAAAMGVEPRNCIMVGDSDVDIATARNAGMLHIGVTWGFKEKSALLRAGATHLANSTEELEKIIEELEVRS